MTTSGKKPSVDIDLVRGLAAVLQETGLTEIEYGSGDLRVRVAKTGIPVAAPLAVAVGSTVVPGEAEVVADHPGVVTSPMVGVAYTATEPEAPPFVKVGDSVAAGDTILLIEAMKVFNPIKAPRAGRVRQVFVANGTPVEFGEPLMIIE
ncbi:MAG: acetyl-CoA carboxylase biotin carboxyl carrier protein [Rhodospirillales bacterium]